MTRKILLLSFCIWLISTFNSLIWCSMCSRFDALVDWTQKITPDTHATTATMKVNQSLTFSIVLCWLIPYLVRLGLSSLVSIWVNLSWICLCWICIFRGDTEEVFSCACAAGASRVRALIEVMNKLVMKNRTEKTRSLSQSFLRAFVMEHPLHLLTSVENT